MRVGGGESAGALLIAAGAAYAPILDKDSVLHRPFAHLVYVA